MKLNTSKLGITLSKESSLFFKTVNQKANAYRKTCLDKVSLESIIETAYKEMGLHTPHIVYVESNSNLYSIIQAYNSLSQSFTMKLDSDEFTCKAIIPELKLFSTSHQNIQESIISQAEAESTGFDCNYLLTKIEDSKQFKKLTHWRKYHSYNSYTNKSFVRGKKLSLTEHKLFPIEPSTAFLNFFLLDAGLNLSNEEKNLIDTQDILQQAVYNIFAFNGLCLVLLKPNPEKYLLPDYCFTKTNSELSKVILEFVIKNPLLVSSYYYKEEDVLRFCFEGLLYCAYNTGNPLFNQWVVVQEVRSCKTGFKWYKERIGCVNNSTPDWINYHLEDIIVIDGSNLKDLYSALIMECRVEVNYNNLYKVLDSRGFPMTEEKIDSLAESDELRDETFMF